MQQNYADIHAQGLFAVQHGSGANAASVVTVDADPDHFWVLDWILLSYSAPPTDGRLTVVIGGATLVDVAVATAGERMIQFDPPLYRSNQNKNESMVITLSAGGSGVTGRLNVRYR